MRIRPADRRFAVGVRSARSSDMTDLIGVYARLTSHAYRSWYAIPLRLIVGFGFMEHGYAKITRGPENYASILQALGGPLSTSWLGRRFSSSCSAVWLFF